MLETALTAFTIFFVTIDPVGMVPLFVGLTHNLPPTVRRATAWRSVSLAAVILLIFAFAGRPVLHYLGVTIAAFRVAGGILLLLLAVDMVLGQGYVAQQAVEDTKPRRDVSVFPLAVPLIAGPGALTAAILLQNLHLGDVLAQLVTALVMLGVLGLVLLGFILAEPAMKVLSVGAIHVFSRVLGIVLTAIAVNNIIGGIGQSFPGLGGTG